MNARLIRGKTQRIYLLGVMCKDNMWYFEVKGLTSTYKCKLSKTKMMCTCPDNTRRKSMCKHLYFILYRIAKMTDITNQNINMNQEIFDALHKKLIDRFSENKIGISIAENNNKEGICTICFEDLNINGELLIECKEICHNYFHSCCINQWLLRNETCPLCRSKWFQNNEGDELSLLTKKNIDTMHC